MKDVTYESIAKLIKQQTQLGNTLHVVFSCPVTGICISGYAAILPEQPDIQALDHTMSDIRSLVMSAVRETLCNPRLIIPSAIPQQQYSLDALHLAAATAFHSVQQHFVWDKNASRWVSRQASVEFETNFIRQLSSAPITAQHDCTVLAQLLIEIANADGKIAPEEKCFLETFLKSKETVVIANISLEALANTKQRETVLMLCWALALCDQNLDHLEGSCLQRIAQGLDLSDARIAEIKTYAKQYVVDQALQSQWEGGQSLSVTALETARRVAKAIGLQEQEQVIDHFRKRNHLDT